MPDVVEVLDRVESAMRWRSRGLAYCIEKVSDFQGRAFERGAY